MVDSIYRSISTEDEAQTVYTGIHTGKKPAGDTSLPDIDIILQVPETRITKDGTHFLFPEIETFWTNLYESLETVLRLYREHGTSEQFHSELKSDMNIERLPSGKFAVNAIKISQDSLRHRGGRNGEIFRRV